MRGDIAFRNADYSNYATPNAIAMSMFSEESRSNPAIFPDEEMWRRTFPYYPKTPIEMRALTRVLARVKSGL